MKIQTKTLLVSILLGIGFNAAAQDLSEKKLKSVKRDLNIMTTIIKTAINDKELIDILLLSTEMAREHQTKDPASQWVHLQAITHAPAASFVGSDIRHACQQAIEKGLVEVHFHNLRDYTDKSYNPKQIPE